MDIREYQREARRTRVINNTKDALTNWVISINEEAGEVAGVVKKFLYHGHNEEESRDKVKKELGDLIWYLDAIIDWFGFTWQEVFEANIEKLRERYPEGFSCERSRVRKEESK